MKLMNIEEFKNHGFLHEVNRLFFHPLGMALVVEEDKNGEWKILGILDNTDDLEGMVFKEISLEKVEKVQNFYKKRKDKRLEALGFIVQPCDPTKKG